jgi:iron complex transport system permease protein
MKGRSVTIGLFGGFTVLLLAGVLFGSSDLGLHDAWSALLKGPTGSSLATHVIWNIRMPRLLVVALTGAALSASGAALQSLFRNPLADSSLLGISSGASLAAVLWLTICPEQGAWLPVAAFFGALIEVAAVWILANLGGRPNLTVTLLTGVALSSLCSALVGVALLLAKAGDLSRLVFWLSGGAEARSWSHLAQEILPAGFGIALLWLLSRWLDALSLGEEHALSVGVPVQRARWLALAGAALATGAAVSVCGPVGFVGLIVPHALRGWMHRASARRLVPLSALGGGVFLMFCDTLARVFLPTEIQMGAITSFLGVPFFLWLLSRSRQGIA